MKRKSIIRSIAGLNLGLAVLLLALLSTISIPFSMAQAVATPDVNVIFSDASSNDPTGTLDPGYDKDVAYTEVSIIESQTLRVTVTNAYPGYSPMVTFNLTNVSGTLAKVMRVSYKFTGLDDAVQVSKLNLKEDGRIPAGGEWTDQLGITVLQSAEENATYEFSVTINFEGSEGSPSPPGPSWPEEPGVSPSGVTEITAPACDCKIIQLTVSPYEVNVDEPVTVGVLITNPCDEDRICEVVLKIDGVIEDRKEVLVKAGETKQVLFTTSKHSAGTYSVEVNGYYAGTLVVKEVVFPTPPPPMPKPFPWWLIVIIALGAGGIASLITYLVSRRKRKQGGVSPGD